MTVGGFCFNRNIVECKAEYVKIVLDFTSVLIETLWNVKRVISRAGLLFMPVLIETLWNVKTPALLALLLVAVVLIETLWNVKFVDFFSRLRYRLF